MSEFFEHIKSEYSSNKLFGRIYIDIIKIYISATKENLQFYRIKSSRGKWSCYTVNSGYNPVKVDCEISIEIIDDFVKITFNDNHFRVYKRDFSNFRKKKGVHQGIYSMFNKDDVYLRGHRIDIFYENLDGLDE